MRGRGGEDLGYLRRTLAKVLAVRIREEDAALSGCVACDPGEQYRPGERLYLRVRVMGDESI